MSILPVSGKVKEPKIDSKHQKTVVYNHRRPIPTIPATTSRTMPKGESERTAAAAKS